MASDGKKLRSRREAVHMSRAALAALAGVSVSTIVLVEADKVSPTVRTIERIESALSQLEGAQQKFYHSIMQRKSRKKRQQ